MRVLLPIHPQHVAAIFSGRKRFEFRRRVPKSVKRVVVYCTAPVMRIVGEFDVAGVLSMPPAELWNRTGHRAGCEREQLLRYFEGRDVANALVIGDVRKYGSPLPLSTFGVKVAPQSFVYLQAA